MKIHSSKKAKLVGDGDEKDEISQLCDDLLIKILSFLSFKEAVRSSVISRRWQHLWKYFSGCLSFKQIEPTPSHSDLLSNLDWPNVKIYNQRRRFVDWLYKCLISNRAPAIDEFRVYHNLNKHFKRFVDDWVGSALRKKVKKLELNFAPEAWSNCCHNFHSVNDASECYYLSKDTFSSGLSGIRFLTSLSLVYVGVSDEMLEYIFSSCPLLESLDLRCCSALLSHPKVSALRLKHLNMYCRFISIQSMEIDAPNLVSFEYFGAKVSLHIKYAPKLAQLYFNDNSHHIIRYLSSHLADHLPRLVTLSIGTSDVGASHDFPELTSLKRLRCEALAHHVDTMLCLISLIEAAPFLHKFELVVRGIDRVKKIKESELQAIWTRMREHPHKCVKEVEIVDFRAGVAHVEILTYLLKNAVMLEKLVIDTSRVFIARGEFRALSRGSHYRKKRMAKHIINQLMQNRPGPQLVLI